MDDGPGGSFQINEGGMVVLTAGDMNANDTDVEDGIPSGAVSITSLSAGLSVVENPSQSFTFIPNLVTS